MSRPLGVRGRLVGSVALVLAVALGSVAIPGAPVAADEPAPVPSPSAPPVVVPPEFTVSGAGFGHAVGMPQWGAYGMAKAGFDSTGIVTHYYSGTTVTPVQDDMEARVNLLYQVSSSRMRSQAMDPSGGAIEVTVGPTVVLGSATDEFRFEVRDGAVHVERTAGGQVADLGVAPAVTVRWAGTRVPGTAAGGPTLMNVVGPSTSLDSSGHRYRFGSIEVVPVSTSSGVRLNVVNLVRIHDEYLYGISEVSSSWPDAAQQAQVLAARTYALSKVARGVRQACGCHMDDGGGPYYDQTFTGWIKASSAKGDQWVRNVDATRASDTTGLAILYNGAPISAFYSASSGGATQSVQDVWGGTLPYAVSVADPYSLHPDNPDASWTVKVGQATMARIFGLPDVASVAVGERQVSTAAKTLTATSSTGAVASRTINQFRSAVKLKSSYVFGVTTDGSVVPPPTAAVPAPPVAPVPAVPAPPAETAPPATQAVLPNGVRQRTVSLLTPVTVAVVAGRPWKVVGVVRPAKAGLTAVRQRSVAGQWRPAGKDRTSAKGRYRFVRGKAAVKDAGTYRVLVLRKGTVVGVSPEFTVTVS